MKKIFSVFLILLVFLLTITSLFGYSAKGTVFALNNIIDNSEFKSQSVYLMDSATQTEILEKNKEVRLPIASMTKIMTLLLCFEAQERGEISDEELITISENASGMGGSQIFLETNGQYSVSQLIKGITVASANDACVAIAERLCGSEEEFVKKMNERANELEMNNTCFANCTGLPKQGQYSSAEDVAKMFCELLKHESYFKYSKIWMDEIKHPKDRITQISNTNKLVKFYNGCDSGKTGYTSEAGHCLVASAQRNGMRLISVVISAPDSKTRFNEVSSMFNYGFSNFVNKIIIDNTKPLELKVNVLGGKKDKLDVIAENSVSLFSKKNEKRAVDMDFEPTSKVKAPINKGDKVGVIRVYENSIEIACVNVLANENINEKTYFDIIQNIGKEWAII